MHPIGETWTVAMRITEPRAYLWVLNYDWPWILVPNTVTTAKTESDGARRLHESPLSKAEPIGR